MWRSFCLAWRENLSLQSWISGVGNDISPESLSKPWKWGSPWQQKLKLIQQRRLYPKVGTSWLLPCSILVCVGWIDCPAGKIQEADWLLPGLWRTFELSPLAYLEKVWLGWWKITQRRNHDCYLKSTAKQRYICNHAAIRCWNFFSAGSAPTIIIIDEIQNIPKKFNRENNKRDCRRELVSTRINTRKISFVNWENNVHELPKMMRVGRLK